MRPRKAACLSPLLLLAVALFPVYGKASSEPYCVPKISKKRALYCGYVSLGEITLSAKGITATVVLELESDAFSALERVNTSHGPKFRNHGRPSSKYPTEFTLMIKRPAFIQPWGQSSHPFPMATARIPPEILPRHVTMKWLDPSGHVIAERSTEIKEVVESWPEGRTPSIWYQGEITGVGAPLNSDLEVRVTGEDETLIGTVRSGL